MSTENDQLFWENLWIDLNNGKVMPIISNALTLRLMFRNMNCSHSASAINEVVANQWSNQSKYPFLDSSNLTNVAQYDLFNEENPTVAKSNYRKALKSFLVQHLKECVPDYYAQAEKDGAIKDGKLVEGVSISEVLKNLNLLAREENDISRLAATKKINIYLTTSYFNIIEQILEPLYDHTYTQVYKDTVLSFQDGEITRPKEEYDPRFSKVPLVYHLFGHEQDLKNMVLAEDDHINFLIDNIQPTEDWKSRQPNLPEYIEGSVRDNTLLFLGYRWQDWDFRTVFRWITGFQSSPYIPSHTNRSKSIVLQLEPVSNTKDEDENQTAAKNYLETYFERSDFMIKWMETDIFVKALSNLWKDKVRDDSDK